MAKETKSTAKKKPERKAPELKSVGASAEAPLIDPLQSAAAAAALVGHKIAPPTAGAGQKTESTSFKNLKNSLAKPHIGGVLDKIACVEREEIELAVWGRAAGWA